MKSSRLNIVLLITIILILIITYGLQSNPEIPNYEFLPDMKYSPAYDSYSKNPNFKNGQTLQSPVEGTIARGESPLHYLPSPEDAVRAGEELKSPFKNGDEKVLERGAEIYRIYCTACHGATGLGDGPVAKKGYPPPPSLLTGKSITMKEGQLFYILTYGQGNMAPYAAQISVSDRWKAVAVVKKMQDEFKKQQSGDADTPGSNTTIKEKNTSETESQKNEN